MILFRNSNINFIKGLLHLLFIYLIGLSSCNKHLTIKQLSYLQRDISEEQAEKRLKIKPSQSFNILVESSPDTFKVNTFELTQGVSHTWFVDNSYKSNYFLCFKNGKLFFWGFPHEFARSNDPLLNEIGKKSVVKIR